MSRGAWEPVKWKAGDRVRVRISGECPLEVLDYYHGAVGTVSHIHPAGFMQAGHDYGVEFGDLISQHYAAVELEPAPGAPATEGV